MKYKNCRTFQYGGFSLFILSMILQACHRVIGTNRKLHGYGGGIENEGMVVEAGGGGDDIT